ncbi:MAG: copper resistance protein B [Alphaproteobacteria bacterium]
MRKYLATLGLGISLLFQGTPAFGEQVFWGVQVEQFEYRLGEGSGNALAWDFDALVGNDDLKFVWRSEAEYATHEEVFEALENQARLQVPISTFFDAVVGVRVETPRGQDRLDGVVGVHGLAEQWFEVDADLFVSENPSARFEVEYEGLITNYLILTPSIEMNLPFNDDPDREVGAFGPQLELGLRLSYDIADRLLSPYVGVHYERLFGDTADIAKADGKDDDAVFGVVGLKMMF